MWDRLEAWMAVMCGYPHGFGLDVWMAVMCYRHPHGIGWRKKEKGD